MLRKLIKYDLMADWKKYAVVYASTLLLSIMTYILEKNMSALQNNIFLLIVDHLVSAALICLTIASMVLVFAFAVMRFYKNLVRDEGYLMHTLPVHTWQLIASKLITVYIWSVAAVIVTAISVGIVVGEPFWIFEIADDVGELVRLIKEQAEVNADAAIAFIWYTIITFLLTPFYFMSHVYFSLALGNLFSSRKLGMSVLMFFAINIGEQILAAIIMSVNSVELITAEVPDLQAVAFVNNVMLASLIISTVLSIGMLIGAERIFAKKLNLE